jgi:hypothetical protein
LARLPALSSRLLLRLLPLVLLARVAGLPIAAIAQEAPSDAVSSAARIVKANGGEDRLLRLFRFRETYFIGSSQRGTDRESLLEPPAHWWVDGKDRVIEEKEPAVWLVWAWTLQPLTDPATTLALLPSVTNGNSVAHGLKLTGRVQPEMHVYFETKTDLLTRIDWNGRRYQFSAPVVVDGARVPTRIDAFLADGSPFLRTQLRDIERVARAPGSPAQPQPKTGAESAK